MGLISDIRQDLDTSALQLITEYRDRLFAEAVRLCADVSAAEDLVSRTLDKAIRNLESNRKESSVFGWMKSIMQNLHRNDNRSPVVRGTTPVDPSVLEERSEADWTTDEEILRRSDSQALREALGRLDPEFKRAMVLHYLAEMPVKQIAVVMNAPVGTVLWRLSIARKILARDLGEKLGKKPLAVLLAALLGIGSLFGAWQAGLLDPLFSQSGEAERGAIAQAIGEALPESFPLQEETASTQTQPQPEAGLAQEKTVSTQTESKESQNMNLKTVKSLAASAVVAASAAVNAGTTDDYVQDGLIAMWDGYENNGAGGHATELSEWKDTTGQYSFVFNANSGITVDGASLVFSGASGCYATLDATGTAATFDLARNGTMEIVFKGAADQPATCHLLQSSTTSGISAGSYTSPTKWIVSNVTSPCPLFDGREDYTTLAVRYTNGGASASYANAEALGTDGNNSWSGANTTTYLGARASKSSLFKGEICAIRLYSTQLTPEQLAANRAVDVKRFVEGNFNLPGVSVQGFPQLYVTAAGEPQYGFFPCVDGETVTKVMPASFVEKGGRRIDCLGWKLYNDATGALVAESDEQNKLKCEFTYLTPVKLVWQWKAFDMLTVQNFDDDLATVYVNDEPTTNGQKVAIDGSVKIELKDFRSDYYFALAPESLLDRTLGFASWDGVPEGYKGENPATFNVTGDLTITPNVNVKGYSWSIVDDVLENEKFRWNFTKDDTKRAVTLKSCLGNTVGATTCTLVLDAVQRVVCDGKVYTITAFDANPDCVFDDSYICQVALPSRFETFGYRLIPSTKGNKSFSIGSDFYLYLSDVKAPSYGDLAYYSGLATLNGPATNFVAQHAVSIASSAFRARSGMTGTLLLDSVQTIAGGAFMGCSGLEGLDLTSTALTTIGASAFSSCTKVKNVTIGSSVLASVGGDAFPSSVENFTFLGAAPEAAVLDKVVDQQGVAVAKTCRLTVDGERADWWARTVAPNGEEIAAGLPENCMGVYKDAGDNRRAWVVSSKPLAGTLIETDMLNRENEGYTMHTGLETGDKLTLTAPEGRGKCELQHLENGVWKTIDTVWGTSVSYQHKGELVRAVWRVDGVALNASTTGYGGKLRVEVKSGGIVSGDNIYSPGSEVWITALGATERPRSAISRWTGVPAGQETDETVKLVLTDDTTVNALFRPLEWVYDPTTRKITDGEYTSSARAADLIGDDGMVFQKFEGANYELWLDLSLPIYNPEDPEKAYWIAGITADRNTTWMRVRFSPHIVSLPNPLFLSSGVLNEVEHFAQVQVEALPGYFFYNYGKGGPIRERVYEAEDFYPPTLKRFGRYAFCSDTPFLKGKMTVGLNDLTGFTEDLLPRCAAVTNWIFTAEDLPAIGWNSASFAPTTVTFASTNLTVNSNGASVFRYGEVRDVFFLAHAPSADAMDALFSTYPQSTNVVIHASRYAPGWKALRAKGYRSMDEWKTCPDGCWGIYQTKDGQKRFYLVQQNSKYDVRNGMMLILK